VYRIVHEIPQSPRAIGAAIDEELEELILSCLEKELAPRPQSARELKQKLQAYRMRVHSSDRAKSVTLARAVRIERPQTPFVDRTEEIKQLQQRLNLAIAGDRRFASIHPVFTREYAGFFERFEKELDAAGIKLRQCEETVMNENRLIPLFHEQVYRFARPEIEGLTISYWSPTVAYEQLRSREI
jgi:hypothetical protein